MVELYGTTTFLMQRDRSIVRHKRSGEVFVDETGLTILEARGQRVFANLVPGQVISVSIVDTFIGRKSTFSPRRGHRVVRIEFSEAR